MTRSAASRDGYGRALLELASNDRVVVLEADLGKSTRSQWFRNEHPDRTISRIGEQNMMLVVLDSHRVGTSRTPAPSRSSLNERSNKSEMALHVPGSPSISVGHMGGSTLVRMDPQHNRSRTSRSIGRCRA